VGPFLKLCAATFLVFNGFMLISSFQFYVIIYYVFGGDTELGAEYAGWSGTIGAVSTFIVIAIVTWMSTHYGKRKAFFIAIGISILGYALKWFCYNPDIPWLLLLPAPLMAFGLGGLFTLMGSMIADVCDLDELETRERREGMFGSIFWWVVKLGMALALAGGGFLLNATGFDVALEGNQAEQTIFLMRFFDVVVPIITSLLAMWAVASFPITEERAHEIRVATHHQRIHELDDTDSAAQRMIDGRHLEPDDAAPDHEQALGHLVERERARGIDDPRVIRKAGQAGGLRTGGDDGVLKGDVHRLFRCRSGDRGRAGARGAWCCDPRRGGRCRFDHELVGAGEMSMPLDDLDLALTR